MADSAGLNTLQLSRAKLCLTSLKLAQQLVHNSRKIVVSFDCQRDEITSLVRFDGSILSLALIKWLLCVLAHPALIAMLVICETLSSLPILVSPALSATRECVDTRLFAQLIVYGSGFGNAFAARSPKVTESSHRFTSQTFRHSAFLGQQNSEENTTSEQISLPGASVRSTTKNIQVCFRRFFIRDKTFMADEKMCH